MRHFTEHIQNGFQPIAVGAKARLECIFLELRQIVSELHLGSLASSFWAPIADLFLCQCIILPASRFSFSGNEEGKLEMNLDIDGNKFAKLEIRS